MRDVLPDFKSVRSSFVQAAATAPLRPPGALDEATFAATCERSGACVTACPVHAIQILRSGDSRRDGSQTGSFCLP